MITEQLRKTRGEGVHVGFYHSVQSLPTPFFTQRYASRIINTNKLLDIRYCSLPSGMTRQDFIKKNELPKKERFNVVGNLRVMEEKDIKEVGRLFRENNERFGIHPIFSKAELSHMLLPKKDVVQTYVVEDPEKKGALTDFMSFSIMHQLVLNGQELGHKYERNTDATFYYYAFTKNKYLDMIKQALWLVKEDIGADALVINLI